MTPFAIVGTVYLILLAICFLVSAASLAVIARRASEKESWQVRYMRKRVEFLEKENALLFGEPSKR